MPRRILNLLDKEPVWTANRKACPDMLCGLWGGVAFVWSVVQAVNRNGSGVGVRKFRGKFQSSVPEIIKRQGAAFPAWPLTLVLADNSARAVCPAPVLKPQ